MLRTKYIDLKFETCISEIINKNLENIVRINVRSTPATICYFNLIFFNKKRTILQSEFFSMIVVFKLSCFKIRCVIRLGIFLMCLASSNSDIFFNLLKYIRLKKHIKIPSCILFLLLIKAFALNFGNTLVHSFILPAPITYR